MKKAAIIALVCVNAALLLALMFGPGSPRANAQVYRGGADYLMITGRIGQDLEAAYLLDLAQRRLIGLRYDRTEKRMLPIRGRRLENDFRRSAPEKPTMPGRRSRGR